MTATWQLEDPKVVDGAKTAKLSGDTEASFEDASVVHMGPDAADPERLELYLPHALAAEFIAGADSWALSFLASNAQRLSRIHI